MIVEIKGKIKLWWVAQYDKEKVCVFIFPHIESSISDQNVLQQYSTSSQKRFRSERLPEKLTATSEPRPRNRFATLLQRRNQEAEQDGQATHSR